MIAEKKAFKWVINIKIGFPGSSSGKESTCNAVHTGSVQCLGKEDPWRRDRLHTPVFLGFPGGLDIKESA